jgi:hypothetical protein
MDLVKVGHTKFSTHPCWEPSTIVFFWMTLFLRVLTAKTLGAHTRDKTSVTLRVRTLPPPVVTGPDVNLEFGDDGIWRDIGIYIFIQFI